MKHVIPTIKCSCFVHVHTMLVNAGVDASYLAINNSPNNFHTRFFRILKYLGKHVDMNIKVTLLDLNIYFAN